MANAAFLLLLTVLATATATAISASPALPLPARRSRFLLKSPEACLVPGSAGTTCCGGQCVDIVASAEHCGGCNKACKHGRTCCGGHCVDLLSDKKNCSSCSNQCDGKCNQGFCNYAQ
nr:stigma-specific STIG1-like protein 1 [Lolium perenne]